MVVVQPTKVLSAPVSSFSSANPPEAGATRRGERIRRGELEIFFCTHAFLNKDNEVLLCVNDEKETKKRLV